MPLSPSEASALLAQEVVNLAKYYPMTLWRRPDALVWGLSLVTTNKDSWIALSVPGSQAIAMLRHPTLADSTIDVGEFAGRLCTAFRHATMPGADGREVQLFAIDGDRGCGCQVLLTQPNRTNYPWIVNTKVRPAVDPGFDVSLLQEHCVAERHAFEQGGFQPPPADPFAFIDEVSQVIHRDFLACIMDGTPAAEQKLARAARRELSRISLVFRHASAVSGIQIPLPDWFERFLAKPEELDILVLQYCVQLREAVRQRRQQPGTAPPLPNPSRSAVPSNQPTGGTGEQHPSTPSLDAAHTNPSIEPGISSQVSSQVANSGPVSAESAMGQGVATVATVGLTGVPGVAPSPGHIEAGPTGIAQEQFLDYTTATVGPHNERDDGAAGAIQEPRADSASIGDQSVVEPSPQPSPQPSQTLPLSGQALASALPDPLDEDPDHLGEPYPAPGSEATRPGMPRRLGPILPAKSMDDEDGQPQP